MKAQDSVKNFYPTLRMYTNFAVRTIKKVCADIGPREAGTKAELDAQNFMAQQVGDAADEVMQEEFGISPRAFLGWPRISGICLLIALACGIINVFAGRDANWAPYAFIIISAFILAMILIEFLFYSKFLDPFFPKAISHNTYCVRKASGETKRRIIIGGHSDSSIEWRPTHIGGSKFLYFAIVYPVVGWIYTFVIGVVMLACGKYMPALVWIDCAFLPGYVFLLFFMNYKVCVDGANDNLTGCMTAAAVLKFMGDNNLRFENTEVIAMFSGAEESGLRGAKASAKLHPEFKDPNVETVFVSFDTIKDYDDMAIYLRDMTGVVKHDERAAELVHAAGEEAGLDIEKIGMFVGASDAAAMTQAGIPAVLFAAMNPGPPKYYHTRDDRADILEPKTIEKCLEMAVDMVYLFDEQGLKTKYTK
ncbi:MAG: M20/M25/M40 family metallo-hydrolase [Oscillospiraceae bacterium]|nr:M20/M25/M40 family metallo-hydrolase [Oscillospiraceae bacterium]